jgi:hypothetical protein
MMIKPTVDFEFTYVTHFPRKEEKLMFHSGDWWSYFSYDEKRSTSNY